MKLNEEFIDNKLYFYHSAKDLNTAKYIIDRNWRTVAGLYGNGVYGQQYPDPTSKENNLSQSTIARYKNLYGGTYRFKIKHENAQDFFYLDLEAGKKVYGNGYDKNMAIDLLKKRMVPQGIIKNIESYFSYTNIVPALSHSKFNTGAIDGGLLGKYGFKGIVYEGNQDGKCVLYWYPNAGALTVEAYSTNFGKTWIDYDQNNKAQVSALKSEIQDKINELSSHVSDRKQQKQDAGKTPALLIGGENRDWIRIIECGDKAGYNFVSGDFTSGDIIKFAGYVQKQINASSEPKRSNRYNIAIKLLSEVETLIKK